MNRSASSLAPRRPSYRLPRVALIMAAMLTVLSWSPATAHSGADSDVDSGMAMPPDLSLWNIIVPYGSERQPDPLPQAYQEFDQLLSSVNAVHGAWSRPLTNRDQLTQLADALAGHDADELAGLKSPWLVGGEHGRGFFLNSQTDADGRARLSLASAGNAAPVDSSAPMGQFSAALTWQSGSFSEESLEVTVEAGIALGTLLFGELMGSWEALHREFERTGPMSGLMLAAAREPVVSPDWRAADEVLRERMYRSVPELMQVIEGVSRFEDLVGETEFVPQSAGAELKPVTHLKIVQRLDLDALADRYPKTWDTLQPLLDHVTLTSDVLDDRGRHIVRFGYNPDTAEVTVSARISEGGFVLREVNGELSNTRVFPARTSHLDYQVVNQIKVSAFGLDVYLRDLTLDSRFRRDQHTAGETAVATMQLQQIPTVQVEGALLHLLPAWLIDALIPGTIEGRIEQALAGLAQGRKGEGTLIQVSFRQTGGRQLMAAKVALEMPHELMQSYWQRLADSEIPGRSDKQEPTVLFKAMGDAVRQDFDLLTRRFPARDYVRYSEFGY